MSADEVSALREDLAGIKAILDERTRAADRNSTLLRTVAAVVFIQFCATIFIAGVKTQKLDSLSEEVIQIHSRIDNLTLPRRG
jgi:hypothetical protein